MRAAFAGTPEFARTALQRLVEAGVQIAGVLTQPDRPAGRGLKLQPSAVKAYALERGLALLQPRGLRLDGAYAGDAAAVRAALTAAAPDVLVVAAYGLILPQWVLDLPRLGCLNIHASVLPRWRGAAPIHRAIEAGDAETGITIMQMDAGLDTGGVLLVERVAIDAQDTTARLHDRLAALGAALIVQALDRAGQGTLSPTPQPDDGVTYAKKVDKSEAPIDWRGDAPAIERRLRAFDPFPGATAAVGGESFKVWRGVVVPGRGAPGEVLAVDDMGVTVACGQGALRLAQLQRAGGKRQSAAQFVHGRGWSPGMRLDVAGS